MVSDGDAGSGPDAGGPSRTQLVASLATRLADAVLAGDRERAKGLAEELQALIAELSAPPSSFTADDHAWVRDHAAGSLAEIEAATLRLVALYTSRNLSHAAERLGMAPVSLSRWLGRRELPR